MRALGMAAAVLTLGAAVLNIIWFTRHGFSLGTFFTVAWPAVVGAGAFMVLAIALGVVSVRVMLRADAESERDEAANAEKVEADPVENSGTDGDAPDPDARRTDT